jgi:hypothetical protein
VLYLGGASLASLSLFPFGFVDALWLFIALEVVTGVALAFVSTVILPMCNTVVEVTHMCVLYCVR